MKLDELDIFSKRVLLVFGNDSHRGPGMVVKNLQKGLEAIGVAHFNVFYSGACKYIGVLQFCHPQLLNDWYQSEESLVLGPNLFVLPEDNPSLCQMFDNFVVPSKWVRDLYLQSPLLADKNITIWSVGIDTETWQPEAKEPEYDCFIYHKNRTDKDLAIVEAICKKFDLKYKVLQYGKYDEHELKDLCGQSKFAVLCTGTESQGIAYMQILSTNTPCYVFNNPTWKSEDGRVEAPASSVPYWDERCGYTNNGVDLDHFEEFLKKVDADEFSPRDYILENHTLEKSAQEYYNLLRVSYGDEPIEF